ncbi:SHOCT domain-containing protein [Enterococcus sp. 669A]|uniref:SHOCT domain-containing protein n=1 Tax=Candidatus Enterococcus moelleringii TaxID=2815325 RepID=A0ABS3L951_9ENTE|nr:SHOCT domain-containing protein [Enterococcus sp. 669A]MBO1306162.1 SHOCT domain-containing protein [Enterococcus sp. 669A]
MDNTCFYCGLPLRVIDRIKLADGNKICKVCHNKVYETLNLNIITARKLTIERIDAGYEALGRDFYDEVQSLLEAKDAINEVGIFSRFFIELAAGAGPLHAPGKVLLVQLNDNRIILDTEKPEYYYLIERSFQGPAYKSVFSSKTIKNTTDKTNVISEFFGLGKNNDKTNADSLQKTVETSRDVEIKSLATIKLFRISDGKILTAAVHADTEDYSEILSLQLHPMMEAVDYEDKAAIAEKISITPDEAVERLKQLKELFDLGILSEDEFAEKKREYVKHL